MPKRRRSSRPPLKRARRRVAFNSAVRKVIMKTAETKSNSSSYAARSISTTVDSEQLTSIATGDGSGARDGNVVYARSAYGMFTVGMAAAATATVLRVVLYTPKQESNKLSTLTFAQRIDPDEQTVWMDKLITVNTDYPVKRFYVKKRWYRGRIPGMRVEWKTGTATDNLHNHIYLIMVSNETTNLPYVNGDCTLYYKDP